MKIWIVSSDAYLNDSEKLISQWPRNVKTVLSPIANYRFTSGGINKFYQHFKKIKPEVILTDHGHTFFFLLRIMKALGQSKVRVYTFLRGNYWLEKKNYGKEDKRRLEFGLEVTTNKSNNFNLFEESGLHKKYSALHIQNGQKIYHYKGIVPKKYKAKINSKNGIVTDYVFSSHKKLHLPDGTDIVPLNEHPKISLRHKVKKSIWLVISDFGWRQLFKVSEKIIPVCDYLKTESNKNTRTRTQTCPIGIDEYKGTPKDLKLKHPSVAIIQNHQIAEKSKALVEFAPVVKKLSNVTFYISLGNIENRDNENYQRVIDAFDSLKNVIFVDINPQNREDYLASTDMYVLASGLDCTPATIVEASMMSKPVLASRIGGIPEMIIEGKTGWTIENGDTKEWIKKINLLISDKKLAEKMGTEAKKHAVKTYSTPVVAKRILGILAGKD